MVQSVPLLCCITDSINLMCSILPGRIVVAAAKVAGSHGVGIELNPTAAAKAQQAIDNGKHIRCKYIVAICCTG